MSGYEINPDDVDKVLTYLKHHDPENADKEYAIQLLESMRHTAKKLVEQNLTFAELLELALKKH